MFRSFLALITSGLLFPGVVSMAGQFTSDWRDAATLRLLDAQAVEEQAVLLDAGGVAGLYLSGERVSVRLVPADDLLKSTIELIGIETASTGGGQVGFIGNRESPPLARVAGAGGRLTIDPDASTVKHAGFTGDIPARFGTYALVLDRNGRRTLLGAIARVPTPVQRKGEAQIMGELFPGAKHSMRDPAAAALSAATLQRLGMRLVRTELSWQHLEAKKGTIDWSQADAGFKAFGDAGIGVLDIMGAHPNWSLPFGEPTPSVNPRKPDYVCHPDNDPAFATFIEQFVTRYARDGHAGLWGIEHWNEPWEPSSISGWGSDAARYRTLLAVLANATKKANANVRIVGTGSVMNTEDKLTSDGTNDWLRYLDVLSDHYVTPVNAYGPMVARLHGKAVGETETWGARSETLLVQFMSQFLALGHQFINPCTPDMVFDPIAPGAFSPRPVAAAVAAWNAIIADRPFKRIVFTQHQPWLYQFGADDDAVFVLMGKQLPLASGKPKDTTWPQSLDAADGTLTINDSQQAIDVYDAVGNAVPRVEGAYVLAMDARGWFVRSSRGAAVVHDAVGRGRLVGLRQVQILPGTPASRSRAELPVELHNLRNTSLRGELLVESMLDNAPLRERRDVTLEAGARAVYTIALPAIPSNGWPLRYTFRSELGEERWQEVMQPTGIAPFPAGVKFEDDDAWSTLPATHILRVGPAERNPIEAAWLPFLKGQESTDAPTQRAEVRVAWDEQYLYLDARITAAAPLPKQALARWDEEQYFHSSASAQKDARYADFARDKGIDWSRAAYVYAAEFRAESPWSGDVFQFAIDVDAPADRYRRTHDLSFQLDRLPTGFHTVPDTDFEFALYDTVGGGSELWCILAPDMPRVHHHPRQLRGDVRQHAVTNAKHRTAYVDGVRVYRVGVPWKTLGLAPKPGTDVGLTFRLNQNKIGPVDYGIDRAIKNNGLTLHPYFASSPACVARWTLMENP